MLNKIINWLRTSNLISKSLFIQLIIWTDLSLVFYSFYSHIRHQIYLVNADYTKPLHLLSISTIGWLFYLPKSAYALNSHIGIVLALTTISIQHYIYYLIFRKLFPLSNFQLQNLEKLGYGFIQETKVKDTNGNERVKRKTHYPYYLDLEDRILLGTYNTNKTIEQATNELEELSNCFNQKLVSVSDSNKKGQQLVFTLSKDIFNRIEVVNKSPYPYSLLVGKNIKNEDIVLDLKEDFSIFVGGTSGSGKTILILHIIKQIYESVNGDLKIIILDDKGIDFKSLVDNYGAEYYDSSSLESLEAFNQKIEYILQLKNETKKILASHNCGHAEELRSRNIILPLERTLIFCDEAGAYLRLESETRKEYKNEKKKTISSITIALSQLRAFGVPMIISTQRCTRDEIDVPYDNFQVRLFNGISKEMSSKYCKGLVGDFATPGKWYLSSRRFNGFVKTPFDPNIKTSFADLKANSVTEIGSGVEDISQSVNNQSEESKNKNDSILTSEIASQTQAKRANSPLSRFIKKKAG